MTERTNGQTDDREVIP